MTDAERRVAEIRSIMKMTIGEQPKEEPKKPVKKQTRKAKGAK